MSKIGIDAEAARKIQADGSEFKLPGIPREELRSLTREEWMARFGDVLSSEQFFEGKDPEWEHRRESWWFKEAGRAGAEPPLWMRSQFHIPELDCPPDGDRQTTPVDARAEKPLWAERMGLTGTRQGAQSATIYGHRTEYLPAHKASARSMYERYQPAYQRVINEELPDTADPPDGRFWKAGVAQGVSANPYERRLSMSGRRKPVVIGPRSISVVVDGEGHTLAAAVKDAAWLHPSVEFVGYCMEHPVYRHVNLRVQTALGAAAGAEQALAESLELTQDLFGAVGEAMDAELAAWPERKAQLEAERAAAAETARRMDAEKDAKMARWVAMVEEKAEPWDAQLEVELFGKVISKDLAAAAKSEEGRR